MVETVSRSTLFIISAREKRGSEFDLIEDPSKLDLAPEFSEIHVRGSYDVKGKKVHFRGYVEFSVKSTCSRCAEEFTQSFSEKFSFLFIPEEKENYKEVEGSDLFFYSGYEINFADSIRDSVLLALPVKPLCSENCSGIEY